MFTQHKTLTLAALVAVCASSANAHMQLSWPFPLHSTFNPKTPENARDYSMTSPLVADGYPCKGFINSPAGSPYMDSVVTWKAGQAVNVTLAGTATHLGGSCQFSMSYDQGATWNVIQSYMGGCLTDSTTIDVDIPSEAPSGEALFGWTWFNHAGNREMYMNCAAVTVTGGGSGLSGPTPFVANVNVNDCKTVENIDVVFPDPGSVIHYGGSYASSRPTTPAGFVGSNCVGPGASASPSGSAKASSAAPSSSAAASAPSSSSPVTSTASSAAEQTSVASSSSPIVNEHVVSTPSEGLATSTTQDSVTSTGTATASAVTSTTTSHDGKKLVKVCRRKAKRNLEVRRSRKAGAHGSHGSAWAGVW